MSEAIESMVRTLAQLPEQQQRQMIKTRLEAFAAMQDEQRVNAMQAMVNAIQKLDQDSQRNLTYARLEVLAEEFDDASRKKLIGTHMQALMGLPKEKMMQDLNTMVSVINRCHEACRMKDMNTMKQLMMEMPQERREMMMQMLPEEVRSMLLR
ncbi:MAG: hypothetical protein JRN68_03145 [Nitrososphaerota archaeon]|jgi:phage-related protein|nr:hypothetical protein [Nitrososphaerota archaeon]